MGSRGVCFEGMENFVTCDTVVCLGCVTNLCKDKLRQNKGNLNGFFIPEISYALVLLFLTQKFQTMTAATQNLKTSIYQIIENEQDELMLKVIRDVILSIITIKKERRAGYTEDGSPITEEEFEQIVVNASSNAKSGVQLTSHDELLKQMKDW